MSEQNNNHTDDVIDIINKKKQEKAASSIHEGDAPTRIDNNVVPKKAPAVGAQASPSPTKRPPMQQPTPNSTVSLSDFDTVSKPNPKTAAKKKSKIVVPRYVRVLLYLFAVILASVILSVTAIQIGNDVFAFEKPDEQINISLDKNATLDDVADVLKENGIIKFPFIFKMYYHMRMDDNSYYSGDFISGKHNLNSNLSYDSIFAKIAESSYSTEIVTVTIPEGYSAYEIIDLFIEKRVISEKNKEKFISKLNSLTYDYDFIPEFAEGEGEDRIYMLEGYLFPDTYQFYVNENLDSVIDKLLTNFDKKFEDAYYERAADLGFTIDEVITLASMIQAEGNNDEDYYKISSVFHNRLKNANFPYLGSDATTLYSFQGEKKKLDAGDNQNTIHPYNTYLNRGLPPGPICNPGTEAIHAALYPETTSYYYFYTASTNGVTYFSSNESQHNRYIQADVNGTLN